MCALDFRKGQSEQCRGACVRQMELGLNQLGPGCCPGALGPGGFQMSPANQRLGQKPELGWPSEDGTCLGRIGRHKSVFSYAVLSAQSSLCSLPLESNFNTIPFSNLASGGLASSFSLILFPRTIFQLHQGHFF